MLHYLVVFFIFKNVRWRCHDVRVIQILVIKIKLHIVIITSMTRHAVDPLRTSGANGKSDM